MKIQLSITMLVSDRQTTAEKCLDSLVPILNAVPSELVVVFTGKDPEVRKLISLYTDQIIDFEWCDDFAKARNAGLNQTCGEWIMFIDDDEWFEDPAEIIEFFQTGEYKQYYFAAYSIRNYLDWEGRNYQMGYVGRMTRRMPDTQFVGKIHEYLNPRYQPQKYFDAWVHHYGYVKKRNEDRVPEDDKKAERNISMLLEEVKKGDSLIRNYTQLVQEYGCINNIEKAKEYAWKVLELVPANQECQESRFAICFIVDWIRKLEGAKTALETGRKFLKERKIKEIAKLYLYHDLCMTCMDLKDFPSLLEYARKYKELFEYLDQHPEVWVDQAVLGVNENSASGMRYQTYACGLVAAAAVDDYEAVMEFLSAFPWDQAGMTEQSYKYLDNWQQVYWNKKEKLWECFEKLQCRDSYVIYHKAILEESRKNTEEAAAWFYQCEESHLPWLRPRLLRFGLRNELDLSGLIKSLDLTSWRFYCNALVQELDRENMGEFLKHGERSLENCPLYRELYRSLIWERMLRESGLENQEFHAMLKEYCQNLLSFYGCMYSERALKEFPITVFPEDYQYAFWMKKGLDGLEHQADLPEGIRAMKQAVGVYQGMVLVTNRLLDMLKKKMGENEAWNNPEFIALGKQIRGQVEGLIEQGQYQAAFPIISQLCQLMPKNLDALKLKLRLYKKI